MTSDPASEVIRGRKFKKCIFLHSEGNNPSGTEGDSLRAIEAGEAVEAVVDVSKRGSLGPRDSMASGC